MAAISAAARLRSDSCASDQPAGRLTARKHQALFVPVISHLRFPREAQSSNGTAAEPDSKRMYAERAAGGNLQILKAADQRDTTRRLAEQNGG